MAKEGARKDTFKLPPKKYERYYVSEDGRTAKKKADQYINPQERGGSREHKKEHPKITAALKNGTYNSELGAFYKDMDPNLNLSRAGIPPHDREAFNAELDDFAEQNGLQKVTPPSRRKPNPATAQKTVPSRISGRLLSRGDTAAVSPVATPATSQERAPKLSPATHIAPELSASVASVHSSPATTEPAPQPSGDATKSVTPPELLPSPTHISPKMLHETAPLMSATQDFSPVPTPKRIRIVVKDKRKAEELEDGPESDARPAKLLCLIPEPSPECFETKWPWGPDSKVSTDSERQEESFHNRPSIKLPMPDHLKAILVDDWENVTKNNQLVPLPHPHPVEEILKDYLEYEKPSRQEGSAGMNVLEETIAGLREYFDKSLGRILLYK